MRTKKYTLCLAGALLAVASLSGCASSGLTRSQLNTGIGAVAGGVAGNLLLGGPVATISGAAVGAVVGNKLSK
ncbi:MAG: glycine zipper 2TM domain-containing protein [Comamonas sp.]